MALAACLQAVSFDDISYPAFPSPSSSNLDYNMAAAGSHEHRDFACSVCQKAFEKRASRDRHQRRCRNKRPGDVVPRRKSCSKCAASKARCDLVRPKCSRCVSKGIDDCSYAAAAPPPPSSVSSAMNGMPHTAREAPQNQLPSPGFETDMLLDPAYDLHNNHQGSGVSVSSEMANFFGWMTSIGPGAAGTSTGNPYPPLALSPPPSVDMPPVHQHPDSQSGSSVSDSPQFPRTPSSCGVGDIWPAQAFQDDALSGALVTQTMGAETQLVGRLLSPFPLMIKRASAPPPFIHASALRLGHRQEVLANCVALVHLWAVRTEENRRFVGAMVNQEMTRLYTRFETEGDENQTPMSEEEKLASMQALLVYVLLRHFDPNPPPGAKLEITEMARFENCILKLGMKGVFYPPKEAGVENKPSWQEWIHSESKRRTVSTLFLFHRYYNLSHGFAPFTCEGLGTLPLPSTRKLWEAEEAKTWDVEYDSTITELRQTIQATQSAGDDALMRGDEEMRWFTFKDLWDDGERVRMWVAGVDALGAALMADSMAKRTHLEQSLRKPPGGLGLCDGSAKPNPNPNEEWGVCGQAGQQQSP